MSNPYRHAEATPGPHLQPPSACEMTELRVVPIRVAGGSRHGDVQFVSRSEEYPFTLTATIEDARRLGGELGRSVDVELQCFRSTSGRIERGRVLAVHTIDESVEPAAVAAAWRAWFSEVWCEDEPEADEDGRQP